MLRWVSAAALAMASTGLVQAKEQIDFWFWGAPPALQEALQEALVKPFNESQEDYELVIEFRGGVTNAIRTAVMAGEGPDIVYSAGPSEIAPFVKAGRLADLSEYAAQYGWNDRLLEPIANTCKLQGSFYCMPISMITGGMFYNKSVLDAHGWAVPTNRAEVEAIMDAAIADGLYASVTGNKGYQPVNANYASLFLNNSVGPVALYDVLSGTKSWSDPELAAALDLSGEWFRKGYLGGQDYFELNFDQSISLLSQERAPFFFGPSLAFQWATAYFVDDKADDLGFAPFPSLNPEIGSAVYDIGVGNSLAINEASDVKDGAAMVIDRILSADFVSAISEPWPGFWAVPLKDFPTDPNATGLVGEYYKALAGVSAAVGSGQFGFKAETFLPPATSQALIKGIEEVWLEQRTSAELLEEVSTTYQREVDEGSVQEFPKPQF